MARRKYSWWEVQPERRTVRLGYASTDGKIGETEHPLGRFKSAEALAHSYNVEARRFLDFWSKYGSGEPVGTFYWAYFCAADRPRCEREIEG